MLDVSSPLKTVLIDLTRCNGTKQRLSPLEFGLIFQRSTSI
jgi:hypothetical protein